MSEKPQQGPVNPGSGRPPRPPPYTKQGGWKYGYPFPILAYLRERVSTKNGQTFLLGKMGHNCWVAVFRVKKRDYNGPDFCLCMAGPAMMRSMRQAYEGPPPKPGQSIARDWKEKRSEADTKPRGRHDEDDLKGMYGVDEISW